MKVSRFYGGIDDDVRRLFFELDAFRLNLVFNVYERDYGQGKRKYAEATYAKWRSGSVQMGGDVSERLIRIVPQFLSFEQKYDLIEKLWNRLREKSALSVTISPCEGLNAGITAVMDAIDTLGEHEIPAAVVERVEWLANDDSVAAKALLAQIAKRKAKVAVEALETELRQLLRIAAEHHDKVVIGSRNVSLPGVTVCINISQAVPTSARRPAMTDQDHGSDDTAGSPLAPREENAQRSDLAPIQNPNDLLGEALRRISPHKQEQIIGKVAEEVARIQVKREEGKVDHEMAASKVEQASNAATRLGNSGNQFEVKADHHSEHGSVHVTVRNKPATLRERLGKCFVATACYGDCSHPTVIVLRRFRDRCLRRSNAGRSFIAWYYRNGPGLAARIEKHALLRATGRVLLAPLARLTQALVWIVERTTHG